MQSGKTSIANFLSESINIEEAETPRPTQGVRIVEFEISNLNVNGKSNNIDIELWDCSGDHRYVNIFNSKHVEKQMGVVLIIVLYNLSYCSFYYQFYKLIVERIVTVTLRRHD